MRSSAARALLLGSLACAGNAASACDFEYQVVPRFDTRPRGFDVALSFDAGGRERTWLRLHDGFAGVNDLSSAISNWSASPDARVAGTEDRGTWTVEHRAGSRITVRYRVRAALDHPDSLEAQPSAQQYRPQVGGDWLQFIGYAALVDVAQEAREPRPPPGAPPPSSCVRFEGLSPRAVVLTSHGVGKGPSAQVRVAGRPAALLRSFYAAGTGWRLTTRTLASGDLHVATRGRWTMTDAQFADAVARLIGTQRSFWGGEREADQLVVLTPNQAAGLRNAGLRLHRTAVLHAARDFRPDSAAFEDLIGHENLHEWIPGRLGGNGAPGQAALATWFSEGFTDYYTHRLLLRDGSWSLERYARELTSAVRRYRSSPHRGLRNAEAAMRRLSDREIGQLPYLRGEFLALRWDAALRARGHAGLDAVMRSLLLPATPAPPAEPSASDRLLRSLAPVLGEAPLADLARYLGEAQPFAPDAIPAGPCFEQGVERVRPWTLGFSEQSFETRRITGLDPDGPAAAAGIRNGMSLAGWSLPGRDSADEVELQIYRDTGDSWVRVTYRPIGKGWTDEVVYRPRPQASGDPACQAWVGR